MSHATGLVKFNDGEIRFYEYNGTGDYVISRMYKDMQGVMDNWRSEADGNECNCGCEEPVTLFSNYGGGFYIDGFACKNCDSVRSKDDETGWFDTLDRNETDDWEKNFDWETEKMKI